MVNRYPHTNGYKTANFYPHPHANFHIHLHSLCHPHQAAYLNPDRNTGHAFPN
jgi:hypothetical protein